MFVINHGKKALMYNINGRTAVIKPGMNCIDAALFPIEGLMKTYGPAIISIIGEKLPNTEKANVEAPAKNKEVPADLPDKCKPCYEDGKNPAEQDCEKCKEEAEAKAQAEAEEQARLEAEEQARLEAEEQARLEAEAKAKAEAEAKAKAEAEAKAQAKAKSTNKKATAKKQAK